MADVLFERGRGHTTIQATNDAQTREEAIQLAKAVLHRIWALEHRYLMGQTKEQILHTFDLCGNIVKFRDSDDDITREFVEYYVSAAQDIFYDYCDGDVARVPEDRGMVFTMRILRLIGCSHVPADPLRERKK